MSETDWDDALKWAEDLLSATDIYVNWGRGGSIPTAITKLAWEDRPGAKEAKAVLNAAHAANPTPVIHHGCGK